MLIFLFAAELARKDVQTTERFKSLDEIDTQLDALEAALSEAKSPSVPPADSAGLSAIQVDTSKLVGEWTEALNGPLIEELEPSSRDLFSATGLPSSGDASSSADTPPLRTYDLQHFIALGIILPMRFFDIPSDPREEAEIEIVLPTVFQSRAAEDALRPALFLKRDQLIAIADQWRALRDKHQDEYSKLSTLRQRLLTSGEVRAARISDQLEQLKSARAKYLESLYTGKVTGVVPTSSDQPQDSTSSIVLSVQTNINRFGPLLIIMFMISILLALYKYDMRLSAYYHSRADALEMLEAGIDVANFDKLAASLSPEKYDFGKMPKSPADQAIELAKSVLSRTP